MRTKKLTGIALLLLALPSNVYAQTDALERLKSYIEVDTINPPGNETRGVAFFSKIFDEAGIAYETAESAPGRGNIWARLEGGDEPALILLHHMDVVPATEVGVAPIWWTPENLGERSPQWEGINTRTRLSIGHGWWNWWGPGGHRRNWAESSSRQRSRSAAGSIRRTGMRDGEQTG